MQKDSRTETFRFYKFWTTVVRLWRRGMDTFLRTSSDALRSFLGKRYRTGSHRTIRKTTTDLRRSLLAVITAIPATLCSKRLWIGRQKGRQNQRLGWLTTARSKPLIIDRLNAAIRDDDMQYQTQTQFKNRKLMSSKTTARLMR